MAKLVSKVPDVVPGTAVKVYYEAKPKDDDEMLVSRASHVPIELMKEPVTPSDFRVDWDASTSSSRVVTWTAITGSLDAGETDLSQIKYIVDLYDSESGAHV